MNWLDRLIDRNGDVIFILIAVLVAAGYVGVTWYALHHGG